MGMINDGRGIYQKGQDTAKRSKRVVDRDRLARVAGLPCVICYSFNMPQNSPTQVHHCIHERYSRRKAGDDKTIPLCDGHHQGDFDTSKIALHREPDSWKEEYGLDTEWLDQVNDMLRGK